MKKIYFLSIVCSLVCFANFSSFAARTAALNGGGNSVATICAGNNNTQVLYSFNVAYGSSAQTISGITLNTTGTWAASDVINFKVWRNTAANNFGTATLLATITVSGTGTQTVSGLSYGVTTGGTTYFFVTAQIAAAGTAVDGHTIIFNAISTSGTAAPFTYSTSSPTYSGFTTASGSQTILSNPLPIAGASSVCGGSSITLSDASVGYTWSSSNTSTATISTSGVVSGIAAGTTTISYTNSCTFAATKTITVNAPAAITGTSSLCAGAIVSLSDITSGGTWSSVSTGIATIDGSGNVTGVSGGTSLISYTVSGCASTYLVSVGAAPAAISGTPPTLCVGYTTTLTDATSGGVWTSGNTSIATVGSTTGLVTGVGAGSTLISYTTAGCNPVTMSVTINPSPTAISGTSFVCGTGTVTLSDATAGGIWSSSNTSIATVSSTGFVTGVSSISATF